VVAAKEEAMRSARLTVLAVLAATVLAPAPTAAAGEPPATAEAAARAIYDAVSAPAGSVPDWQRVRALFLPEAVVVLRTSRTATGVFTLDGFVRDFVDFYEKPRKVGERMLSPCELGFAERVIEARARELGEIAEVTVLYEARIVGLDRPPTRGVDLWLFTRRDGRWLAAAVVNEVVSAERPLPPDWFGEPAR
jgi:hypothetical protein